jgi:hypothetical protein
LKLLGNSMGFSGGSITVGTIKGGVLYCKGVGCSYARVNKKGGWGLEKPRNETNRENEIYLSGIVLHTHVGTILPTSGGAPRVGGR